jgi:hypothetical protein
MCAVVARVSRALLFAVCFLQATRLPPQKRRSITKNCRAAIFAAGCFCLAARMTALQFLFREPDAELPQLFPSRTRLAAIFPFEKSWIIEAKQLSS